MITPVKDRMVSIYREGASLKCFEIACPCLEGNAMPTMEYNLKWKTKRVTASDFKKIKLVDLPTLINKIKARFSDKFDEIQVYHIIEPEGDHYIIHDAGIMTLARKTVVDEGCCAIKKQ